MALSVAFCCVLKVVEIAPAVQLDPHLRDRLHADAVNLAKQVCSHTHTHTFGCKQAHNEDSSPSLACESKH